MTKGMIQDYSRMSTRRKKKSSGKFLAIFFVLILAVVCGYIASSFLFRSDTVSPAQQTVTADDTKPVTPTPLFEKEDPEVSSEGLQAVIADALTGTKGSYGIVVENLATPEGYFSNTHRVYQSGSLYKLWVMAAVYDQIQKGKLRLSDTIRQNIPTLNKEFYLDPEVAEKKSGEISMTVGDALYQMITISDNYAALLLTDKIKLSTIASFLQQYGFTESKVGMHGDAPITTPHDIALFFKRLYEGKLANAQHTDAMIQLLKQQKLNDKLPKYLPFDVAVAHKTGELDNFTHDAGIVYTSDGAYIIVVLSESDSREQANERIANVSEAVYNYFEEN